jgi:hypothetical protein
VPVQAIVLQQREGSNEEGINAAEPWHDELTSVVFAWTGSAAVRPTSRLILTGAGSRSITLHDARRPRPMRLWPWRSLMPSSGRHCAGVRTTTGHRPGLACLDEKGR